MPIFAERLSARQLIAYAILKYGGRSVYMYIHAFVALLPSRLGMLMKRAMRVCASSPQAAAMRVRSSGPQACRFSAQGMAMESPRAEYSYINDGRSLATPPQRKQRKRIAEEVVM